MGYLTINFENNSLYLILSSISCSTDKTKNLVVQHYSSFCKFIYSYIHSLIYLFYFLSGALTKSQFPVFTIYAQKTCLGIKPCEKAWCFDRVQGYRLNGYVKKKVTATSRQDCLEMCLGEREFACR